jgi:hypothetical protein
MEMLVLILLAILAVPILAGLVVIAVLVWRASREDVEESPPRSPPPPEGGP